MKQNNFYTTLLIIFIFFLPFNIFGQTQRIFNDTNVAKPSVLVIGESKFAIIDFVSNLPDGKYKLYSISDSAKKDLDNFLNLEGKFSNSVRHGIFKYYHSTSEPKKSKSSAEPYIAVNYKNGKLDGQYVVRYPNGVKIEEGHFTSGLKDGFFIYYDQINRDGTITEINVYQKDTLTDWIVFYPDGSIRNQGYGVKSKPIY